jgi:hypothetical protein
MSRGAILSFAMLLIAAACGEAKKPAPPPVAARPTPPSPSQPAAPQSAPVAPATLAPQFDAVSEAAASYRVGASVAPAILKRNAKGLVVVTIEMTRPDVHVQKEFPLSVTIVASRGLKLAKGTVGHADAVDPAGGDRQWNVPLKAVGKGPQKVDVAFRFAICRETAPAWCVVRNDQLSAAAEVR